MSKKYINGSVISRKLPLDAPEFTNFVVGVYGTLRRGMYNHGLMRDFNPLGNPVWLTGYKMYTMQQEDSEGHGHVPYVVYTGRKCNRVLIELYHVNTGKLVNWLSILKTLDGLEQHPSWYTRRLIEVPFENNRSISTWLYLFERPMFKEYKEYGACKPHPTGDYRNPDVSDSRATGRLARYPIDLADISYKISRYDLGRPNVMLNDLPRNPMLGEAA